MPRLNLSAANSQDLIRTLRSVDISVPLRTEGRTTEHCEQYTAARLLSTLAETAELEFPLSLEHQDRPDFILRMPGGPIGIECTEAVSEEWAHIDAIREREFPDSLIMLPMLKPGETTFTRAERESIASGQKAGPPWVGDMAERQWAEAIAHFVGRKTEKLRSGDYGEPGRSWLLIQDEWRVPVYRPEHYAKAAKLCHERITQDLSKPAFARVYVSNNHWLIRLAPGPVQMREVRNLWS